MRAVVACMSRQEQASTSPPSPQADDPRTRGHNVLRSPRGATPVEDIICSYDLYYQKSKLNSNMTCQSYYSLNIFKACLRNDLEIYQLCVERAFFYWPVGFPTKGLMCINTMGE